MLEQILCDQELFALIVYSTFEKPGSCFLTSPEYSQQLACMQHPAGKRIAPHLHNPLTRTVANTQEVLFIRCGRLRVDFYTRGQRYLESRLLGAGDTIMLIAGGHGYEVIEAVSMIEVKQGPYLGDQAKTVFAGIDAEQVRFKQTVGQPG